MTEWIAVITITLLAVISPGPDFAMVTRNSLLLSRRAGVGTALGIALGVLVHVTYTLVGVGLLIQQSMVLFQVLKLVGAAYLIYLGISAWRSHAFAPSEQQAALLSRRNLWLATRQEFLIGISNPKAILLFAAIFPQFIRTDQPATEQFLYLGTTYLLAEYVASLLYALFGLQIRRLIRTARGVRNLNRTTGAFFVGAGGLLLGASQH